MKTSAKHRRQMRRLSARLYGQPLAIMPEKLSEICDFFDNYRSGVRLSESEIRQRIGGYADDWDDDNSIEEEDHGYRIINGVAVLPLQGVIAQRMNLIMSYSGGTSTELLGAAFAHALGNNEVRALVLDTHSPGGEISGVDELSRQIFEARGQKPIIAVANTQMASAAYYIASAADEVLVTSSGQVGSIGTVLAHYETSKLDRVNGIKHTFIHEGRHKVDGNSREPLNDQSRATLQEIVSAAYEDFVSAVARNRGISAAAVKSQYGQGKVFLGRRAVDAGLADRVGTLQEILGELAEHNTSMSAAGVYVPKEKTVNPKIKAALVARGLIDANTDDIQAAIALRSFCVARGLTVVPTDEATVIELLGSATPKPGACGSGRPNLRPPKNGKPRGGNRLRGEEEDPPPVEEEDDDEDEDVDEAPAARALAAKKAARAAVAEERARAAEIRSRGRTLGVSAELIEAAIEEGNEVPEAVMRFTDALAKSEPPVIGGSGLGLGQGGGIRPTGSEVDAFSVAASDVLFSRACAGLNAKGEPIKLSDTAQSLRYSRLLDIAGKALQMSGVRVDGLDPDDIAKKFLAMGGDYKTRLVVGASGYGTPSDYPNILSAVAGKIKDIALETNTSTFREWCHQYPSVPDFKPKTVVAVGGAGELDQVPDGKEFGEAQFGEEASWISTDTYGRKRSLTPKMIVDDDLQIFAEALRTDIRDHDLTINRLAVDLMLGNPATPDGNAMFSSNHANVVLAGAGGAPSVSQFDAMRQLMRQQYDVGNRNRMRVPPAIALVSSKWETVAEQVLMPPTSGFYPATDTNINVFRGKLRPVVEAMLDDHTASTAQVWFVLASPTQVAVIVYMYQTGFENGKLESWYDPETRCRKFSVEGRFGVAVRNWRGAVRNSGGHVNF